MLRELVTAIQSSPWFHFEHDIEWTMEVDPGTFDLDKLHLLKDLGFNSFSLGVQSFEDDILQSLGRTHQRRDIHSSIAMLTEVFGEQVNYSIDLISALPGLSLAQWTETLQTAVSLYPRPRHVSIYDLQIESGTVFGKWYETNGEDSRPFTRSRSNAASILSRPMLPSVADAAFMYRYASGYLATRGYEHYEVSSYAMRAMHGDQQQSPWRSKHNQVYWSENGQWYAFGMGATSFVEGKMQARPRTLFDYYEWVKNYSSHGGNDDDDACIPSDLDLLQDIVLKRLRTSEGLNIDWVKNRFGGGEGIVEAILRGAALGMEMRITKLEGPFLRLTDPDGLILSNCIISSIFVELEELFDT
jgi:coproporphyrinogen III oxidase-like Fe-S oxidoreductase